METYSREIIRFGQVGAGTTYKLVVNLMVAAQATADDESADCQPTCLGGLGGAGGGSMGGATSMGGAGCERSASWQAPDSSSAPRSRLGIDMGSLMRVLREEKLVASCEDVRVVGCRNSREG